MSSEFRPRNGGQGGRRRRGGRGFRPGGGRPAPQQREGNKSANPIKRLFGWLFQSKDQSAAGSRGEHGERPPRERGGSPQPPQEVTTSKLYVGNLSYDALESDLFDLFSKVGSVKNVEVVMDRQSNRSKGFGFVEMESLDRAKEAAEKLNRTEFMGRQIVVSGAKTERRAA